MKRKDFLASAAGLVLASQLPFARLLGGMKTPGEQPVVYEAEGISPENVHRLFDASGGLNALLPKPPEECTVLIKPNLCLPYTDEKAATTSTVLIECFCAALISGGVKRIIIADHTLGKTSDFQNLAVARIPEKMPEVKVVFANEERMFEKMEVAGKALKETAVMKLIGRADLFINLAAAKHHSATQVSLAIKNLMGAIWDRAAFHTKMDLQQAVGDLTIALKPHLNVVDAGRVLLTGGPTGPGMILEENKFFASADIVALDSVVASRYNFGNKSLAPENIAHIRAAYENGAGEINLKKITLTRL